MNDEFFTPILIRTPFYSYSDYDKVDLGALLNNQEFKTALFLASKPFYEELEKRQFDYCLLTDKQKSTIKKYYNRACFRSTPFGLFSAFSVARWNDEPEACISLSSKCTPIIKLDFSVLVKLYQAFLLNRNGSSTHFQPNPSLYFSKTDIRYIKTDFDENDLAQFSIVALCKDRVLKSLLKFCESGKGSKEMASFLSQQTGVEKVQAEQFINELSCQQVIVPVKGPNITGKDYTDVFFSNLAAQTDRESDRAALNVWLQVFESMSQNIYQLPAVSKLLKEHTGPEQRSNLFYAMAERRTLSGGLPEKYQEMIKDGLHCLRVLHAPSQNKDLENFITAFEARYGTQEVPLLEVVDAQLGIGYGEFSKIKNSYSLLSIRNNDQEFDLLDERGDHLVSQLFNEWYFSHPVTGALEIEITQDLLEKVKPKQPSGISAPSISVMFRVLGDKVYIEYAGGCSALSLIGRFSSSAEVDQLAREIAHKEQVLNKNVLFAEIAHLYHLHTANIDRRRHFRDVEIPVLIYSDMPAEKQVHLNDLRVSVINKRVVLRSKKLRKQIIPRLSSAFNYTKSCFPVLRFLCDVQHQGLATDYSFSLPSMIPGLRFYPRIRYKSSILQLAEWHFTQIDFLFVNKMPLQEAALQFQKQAKEMNLPRYFAYCVHDNFLVFDVEHAGDIVLFLSEIRNKEKIVLKEFPFAEAGSPVEDRSRRPLLAQFVASLYRNEEVYKQQGRAGGKAVIKRKKNSLDWLYFKVYCHPLSSGRIICTDLLPLIRRLLRSGNIEQWFWVRYNDPHYHLRVRVRPAANQKGSVFELLNNCFHRLCSLQLVHHFQTDIYQQETERYSDELMGHVEAIFQASSDLIASFLKKVQQRQEQDEQIFVEAVLSIYQYLLYFDFHSTESAAFCKLQFEQFYSEFHAPKSLKQELEKLHRTLHASFLFRLGNKRNRTVYGHLGKNVVRMVQYMQVESLHKVNKEKLAADIIHMHMNRLFSYNQRYFEMVAYFLAYRSLTTVHHKAMAS